MTREAMSSTHKPASHRKQTTSSPSCESCPAVEALWGRLDELEETVHTLEVELAGKLGEFSGEFRSFRHEMKTMMAVAGFAKRGVDIEDTSPPPTPGTQELKTPLGRLRASPLVIVLVIALAAVTAGVSYVAGEVGVARVKQAQPKP